ncbi:MAG: hypothetical protein IMW89_00845 [Ktedonobacteraceae bacterium]|nr:hypothetical protein [Ktedonobacteraceae bacterium]
MNTQTLRQPIKVEMVGLLPTLFSMCAHCCTTDTMGVCGIDLAADQMRDYPSEVVETNRRAAELYRRLLHDYGGAVIPLAVSTASLRGLWLSLRHHLPTDFALVINGRRVLAGDADYSELKRAIEQEMHLSLSPSP